MDADIAPPSIPAKSGQHGALSLPLCSGSGSPRYATARSIEPPDTGLFANPRPSLPEQRAAPRSRATQGKHCDAGPQCPLVLRPADPGQREPPPRCPGPDELAPATARVAGTEAKHRPHPATGQSESGSPRSNDDELNRPEYRALPETSARSSVKTATGRAADSRRRKAP